MADTIIVDNDDARILVSVIVPVFNVLPFLEESLDSVVAQSHENMEVILIDDGSTDGSGSVCDRYAARDNRIRVIHQANRGLSAARNAGLRVMRGSVVVFLDPDDAYRPDYVQKLMRALLAEDADVVICRYTTQRTSERLDSKSGRLAPTCKKPGAYDRRHVLQALARGDINISVWSKLYRREIWEGMRFPEGHNYEDIFTSLDVFDRCRKACVIDDVLYLHRSRPGSIVHTKTWANMCDLILARDQYASFVEAHMPDVFDEAQLRRTRSMQLAGIVAAYARLSRAWDGDVCRHRGELKQRAISFVERYGTACLEPYAVAAYHVMRKCPFLLRPAYPVYRCVRWIMRVAAGR